MNGLVWGGAGPTHSATSRASTAIGSWGIRARSPTSPRNSLTAGAPSRCGTSTAPGGDTPTGHVAEHIRCDLIPELEAELSFALDWGYPPNLTRMTDSSYHWMIDRRRTLDRP